MSGYIRQEIVLFFQSALTGGLLVLGYGLLRALRRAVSHSRAAVAAEDLLYWIFCGIFVFSAAYRENQGNLRFFMLFGACFGSVLVFMTVGRRFADCLGYILGFLVDIVKKLAKWLIFPVKRCKILKRRITDRRKRKGSQGEQIKKKRCKLGRFL